MKLKFSRTTAFGKNGVYQRGQEYEVKDQAAAELYIKHGYATEATGTSPSPQPSPPAPAPGGVPPGKN